MPFLTYSTARECREVCKECFCICQSSILEGFNYFCLEFYFLIFNVCLVLFDKHALMPVDGAKDMYFRMIDRRDVSLPM